MASFRENILGAFPQKGEEWLNSLPMTIDSLQKHWQLHDIHPVQNMSYHYIARAITKTQMPVIVKIGCDSDLINQEATLLKHFSGKGVVSLIDYHPKNRALLLQQAIPGHSLKSIYPEKLAYVMGTYVNTVNEIHAYPVSQSNDFNSIEDWLKILDLTDPNLFPNKMLDKAISMRDEMHSTMGPQRLLHGDLHLDNILKNGEEWFAIDPKGVVGESEFEIAAFDFIAEQEMKNVTRTMLLERIQLLADTAKLSFGRIRDWTFIRLVLSAAWSIEDKGNPKKAMFLAELLM